MLFYLTTGALSTGTVLGTGEATSCASHSSHEQSQFPWTDANCSCQILKTKQVACFYFMAITGHSTADPAHFKPADKVLFLIFMTV